MTMVFQWENYTFRKYYTVVDSCFLGTHKQDTSRDKLPEPFALTMRGSEWGMSFLPVGSSSGPGGTAEDKAFLWLKPSGGAAPWPVWHEGPRLGEPSRSRFQEFWGEHGFCVIFTHVLQFSGHSPQGFVDQLFWKAERQTTQLKVHTAKYGSQVWETLLLEGLTKPLLRFKWKFKRPRRAKLFWKKNNKVRGLASLDSKKVVLRLQSQAWGRGL